LIWLSIWLFSQAVTVAVFILSTYVLTERNPHKGGNPLGLLPSVFWAFIIATVSGSITAYGLTQIFM
jgi:hypothetical protein